MNQAVAADSHDNCYSIPPKPTDGFSVYRLSKGGYTFNVWESKLFSLFYLYKYCKHKIKMLAYAISHKIV